MAALAPPDARTDLLKSLRNGDCYEFINRATTHLLENPGDSYIRLMAIREYLRLNLIEPARELLDVDACDTGHTELDAMAQQIHRLSGTSIPWTKHTDTFQNNLAALNQSGFRCNRVNESWNERQTQFQFFKDANGNEQIRRRANHGRWMWYPYFGDHRAQSKRFVLATEPGTIMRSPIVLEGLGLGHVLERVYQETRNTYLGYSCAIFIVQPDPAIFAAVLHLRDWTAILGDPRVHVFTGPNWWEPMAAMLLSRPNLPLPGQVITSQSLDDAPDRRILDLVNFLGSRRAAAIGRSFSEIEQQYADRDVASWAGRFKQALNGDGEPLRILAAVSRHTSFLKYSIRDCQHAIESLGHHCKVLTEDNDHDIISPTTYHQVIREYKPDLFFILDHLRSGFRNILPANLPLLTWDQDQLPHVFTPENVRQVAPIDFVVGYATDRCRELGMDPRQLLPARVPTNADQFTTEPLSDDEHERYTCDVSYVSHASQSARGFHDQERAQFNDPNVVRLLDTVYENLVLSYQSASIPNNAMFNRLLIVAQRDCGLDSLPDDLVWRVKSWYMWRLADRLFRHTALDWVAGWARETGRNFRIYGHGWEKHPTLGEFAAGPAENGHELSCIYRASRINLQLMPAGFIHQRALDGLAAGGFFLTRLTHGEINGPAYRTLAAHVNKHGITTDGELIESAEPVIQDCVRQVMGEYVSDLNPMGHAFVRGLKALSTFEHADQVFPGFLDIGFDSRESFATKADHFLKNPAARDSIVKELRQVVVKHFGYRSFMKRFLGAMADYLENRRRSPNSRPAIAS